MPRAALALLLALPLLDFRPRSGLRSHVERARTPDDLGFARGAARHARRLVPEFLFHDLAVVVDEVRLVWKLDRRKIVLVKLEILVPDDVVEIEHISGDGV